MVGLHGDALKIRLAAPPLDGRANDALLNFIADCFKVSLRNVELKCGTQSRRKTVIVHDSAATLTPPFAFQISAHFITNNLSLFVQSIIF